LGGGRGYSDTSDRLRTHYEAPGKVAGIHGVILTAKIVAYVLYSGDLERERVTADEESEDCGIVLGVLLRFLPYASLGSEKGLGARSRIESPLALPRFTATIWWCNTKPRNA
jgi:hypothetical protein